MVVPLIAEICTPTPDSLLFSPYLVILCISLLISSIQLKVPYISPIPKLGLLPNLTVRTLLFSSSVAEKEEGNLLLEEGEVEKVTKSVWTPLGRVLLPLLINYKWLV